MKFENGFALFPAFLVGAALALSACSQSGPSNAQGKGGATGGGYETEVVYDLKGGPSLPPRRSEGTAADMPALDSRRLRRDQRHGRNQRYRRRGGPGWFCQSGRGERRKWRGGHGRISRGRREE